MMRVADQSMRHQLKGALVPTSWGSLCRSMAIAKTPSTHPPPVGPRNPWQRQNSESLAIRGFIGSFWIQCRCREERTPETAIPCAFCVPYGLRPVVASPRRALGFSVRSETRVCVRLATPTNPVAPPARDSREGQRARERLGHRDSVRRGKRWGALGHRG